MAIIIDRYTKYQVSKAIEVPKDGLVWVFSKKYWLVVDDCLLFYQGQSPQCNSDKAICDSLGDGNEVRFFETVYIPMIQTYDDVEFDI